MWRSDLEKAVEDLSQMLEIEIEDISIAELRQKMIDKTVGLSHYIVHFRLLRSPPRSMYERGVRLCWKIVRRGFKRGDGNGLSHWTDFLYLGSKFRVIVIPPYM